MVLRGETMLLTILPADVRSANAWNIDMAKTEVGWLFVVCSRTLPYADIVIAYRARMIRRGFGGSRRGVICHWGNRKFGVFASSISNIVIENLTLPRFWAFQCVSEIKVAQKPTTYQWIPRSCAQAHSIITDTQAAYSVVVSNQGANLLATSDIPNLENVSSRLQESEASILPCTQSHHNQQREVFQILK